MTAGEAELMGIVVVNYRSHALIGANLSSFAPAHARVVVVDNFSDDSERASVRKLTEDRGWSLVEMEGNPGFGPGVNAGVSRAQELGCVCFLFLNPDAAVTEETVEALRAACLADTSALVAPLLVDLEGRVVFAGSTLNMVDGRTRGLRAASASPDPRARPITWLTGACLAVHQDLWQRIGGFDEHFFMYWEDVDLVYRALQGGGHVVLRDDLVAVHDQGGTQGPRHGLTKSALYYYYNSRNRMLFGARHLGRRDLLRWLVKTPRISWEILLRGGGRRSLVGRPQLAWSAASGGLAGMWLAATQILRPRRTDAAGSDRLVVQQSFPKPRATTNPYIVMLRDSIASTPDAEVRTFSWSAALMGRYDVFHVHWPEIMLTGQTVTKSLLRQMLTLALLVRLRLTRTPIVRTLHNVGRPDGISWRANAILELFERQTTLVILLNSSTVAPVGVASETIVHGHYRDWFARYPKPASQPGRLSYFGLIRPYKGVDRLLEAFREIHGEYTLWVAGNPSPELRDRLEALAREDDRVKLTLAYVPDEKLVRVASEGELIALPYREMHNSGGALAALSLDRPVLVPTNEVNEKLGQEVGIGWVHTYSGDLTGATLVEALESVRSTPRAARPDLSLREWDLAGRRHVQAYRRAVALCKHSRGLR